MGRERVSWQPQAHDAALTLGQMIRRSRQAQSLTIADLAARAGVSSHTVSAVENGSPTPSIGNAFNIAVSAGVGLFGTDDPGTLALLSSRAQAEANGRVRVTGRSVKNNGADRDLVDF